MKYRKTALVDREGPWSLATPIEGVIPYTQMAGESKKTSRCQYCDGILYDHGWCATLEGGHIVCPCDSILIAETGERWPIKPDIFANTYEAVEEEVDTGGEPINMNRVREVEAGSRVGRGCGQTTAMLVRAAQASEKAGSGLILIVTYGCMGGFSSALMDTATKLGYAPKRVSRYLVTIGETRYEFHSNFENVRGQQEFARFTDHACEEADAERITATLEGE